LVRPLTSALALAAACTCFSQSFGRFGYSPLPDVPGFRFTAEGFRSSSPGATTLRFFADLGGFRPTEVSDRAALYVGPEVVGQPSKVRVNLRAPGFSLYFPFGVTLKCDALQSPFLSWQDASVGPDVPTPKTPWVLVTFQDRQPPVLLVFESGPVEVHTTGKSADWTIATRERYAGWVRVLLPLGHHARSGTDASSLGEIVAECVKSMDVWTGQVPSLVDFEVRSDEASLTAVWTFDRPGALVPPAALMARAGGYPLEVLSGVRQTGADLWEGPTAFTAEAKLAIKFPLRRVPLGRSLAVGAVPTNLIATASPFDVPSLGELALTGLVSGRDHLVLGALDTVTEMFSLQAALTVEPFLQRKLPYAPDGTGVDLAAAHALVQQARLSAAGIAGGENPLLAQVAWRRDWHSWLVWADDQKVARRASALLAVAGALSSDAGRRLDAGLLQAGLAAERALAIYRDRRGFANDRKELIEPMFNVRAGLFGTLPNAFVDSLMSEVRIVSEQAVSASVVADGIEVTFPVDTDKPGTLVFEIGRPVAASAGANMKSIVAKQALGRLIVDYVPSGPGDCSVVLRSPGWANPLPVLVAPPRYVEN
jgi:hypothetical protein